MEHIYNCEFFNQNKPEENFEKIFNGRIHQQILVFQRFEDNFENRKKIITNMNNSNHEIHDSDPQYSDLYSNGYGNG